MITHSVPKRKFLPTLERSEPLIKDHTAVKTFMECKRKYFLRMVASRTARTSALESIFAWGSAVHKFAEVYSISYDIESAGDAASQMFKKPVLDKPSWAHLDFQRFAQTLGEVAKFFDQEKESGFIKTESVETPFNLELPDGSVIGGRIDALLSYSGGQQWVRDLKTTTKNLHWFIQSLDPNDQATRYVYARSRMMGWDSTSQKISQKANGIEFLVISNEAPTKSNKKGPKIERFPLSRSNDQLVEFERQQMFIHKMIDLCREADEWPMEITSNCQWCDYVSVCRAPNENNMEQRLKSDFNYRPWDHQKVEQDK